MDTNEQAAISYDPDNDDESGIDGAIVDAERKILDLKGVKGVGKTLTPEGQDAVLVYVKSKKALSRLPSNISGFPVIGEIVGDVRAQ